MIHGYDYASYYVDGGAQPKTVKQMMDHYYQTSYTVNSSYWQQGLIDKRFKVGDQTLSALFYGADDVHRHKRFFFNKILKHVNMIYGYQRRNRKSMVTESTENEHGPLSDQFTKSLLYSERKGMFHDRFSMACEGSGDTGIGWMMLYLDYVKDPLSGELTWDYVSYNNCLIDPYFRQPDYSDGNFWWRRKWLTPQMAKAMLPGRERDIDRVQGKCMGDKRFPIQAELINHDTSNLIPIDEFYYLDSRSATMVVDEQTGETAEWRGSKDELESIMAPWMIVKKVQRPTVKMAIASGDQVFYDGPNSLGTDNWPMVPVLTYYEPDLPSLPYRLQGVVRNMRDAQFLYNRRKVIELDIMESVANSGYIYQVDALTDKKMLSQTGQGVGIAVKSGRNIRESIQQIQPPTVPPSMIELSRSLAEDITDISGVNEELLGSATDDKAGILAVLRQGAGLTTLQPILDRWDFAHQACGRLLLEAIQKNWTYGKAKQVLGEEPDPRYFDADLSKYAVAVKEGVYSSTQRQMEAQQLIYLRNQLEMPIPDDAIINALQIQNKDDLIKAIQKQNQQQQQAQQAAQQAQAQEAESKAALQQAKTQSEMALAQERQTKVVQASADMALKLSQAEREEAQADLDVVKQLVELDQLSMESLRRSLMIADQIRQESENKVMPQVPAGGPNEIGI